MGLKFSKKRDACASSAEAAGEPAAARLGGAEGQPGAAREGEAGDKQDLDVVVAKPATPVASLPNKDCVWEYKEVKEGEEANGAPGEPSVPQPTADADSDPATGAQVVPPEPEPSMDPVGSLPVDPEPAPEAEAPKDAVTVETVPDPAATSPALGDLAPGPDPAAAPSVNPDDECHYKREETSESLEKLMQAVQLREDVDEGSVDRLLENLELTGSDLVADVTPADTETCDDTPDMST